METLPKYGTYVQCPAPNQLLGMVIGKVLEWTHPVGQPEEATVKVWRVGIESRDQAEGYALKSLLPLPVRDVERPGCAGVN